MNLNQNAERKVSVERTEIGGKKKQNTAGRNSVIMERRKDTIMSDYAINAQTDIRLHNKTQNDK